MLPEYKYAFLDETETLCYYVENNIVKTSAVERYLEESPKDWADAQVGKARSDKYFGVFKKFSVPQSFAFRAKQILEYILFTKGVQGKLVFKIMRRNGHNWAYTEWFKGPFDMTTINSVLSANEDYFQTNILEGGVVDLLRTNESIPYEIPFDNDSFLIHHDGIVLDVNYTWAIANTLPDTVPGFSVLGMAITQDEGKEYIAGDMFITDQNLQLAYGSTPDDVNRFLNTSTERVATWTLSGTGAFNTLVANNQYFISIIEKDTVNNNITNTINMHTSAVTSGLITENINSSGSFTFKPSIYNYFVVVRMLDPSAGFAMSNGTFKLSFKYKSEPSDIRVYRYFTLAQKLVKAALGNNVNVYSSFLATYNQSFDFDYIGNYDNNPYWTTITSGTAIRRLSDPKLKLSLADLRQDLYRWGLGLGVENGHIRIEKLSYFFQANRKVFRLDSFTSISYTNAVNFLANVIKTGYKEQTYDNLNGRQDFHTTSVWSTPLTNVKKEMDWVSPFYASIFAIEYARNQGFGKRETSDTQYDDQIYLIEVNGDPATYNAGRPTLYRPAGLYKYGLLNPESAFNFGLTPAHVLLQNREMLVTMGYGLPITADDIVFQKSDKNASVLTQFSGLLVDEDARKSIKAYYGRKPIGPGPMPMGDAVKPLILPFHFTINAEVPFSILQLLDADVQNNYGVFIVPVNGQDFYFHIDDIALSADGKTYDIRCFPSSENDLLKLIGYAGN